MRVPVGQALELRGLGEFPSEPVGIGGRWQRQRRVVRDGMFYDEHTEFELLAIRGPLVVIGVKLTRRGGAQREGRPTRTHAQSPRVVATEGELAGTLEFDLTRVLPVAAKLDYRGEEQIELGSGDAAVRERTVLDYSIAIGTLKALPPERRSR